ncbi:hypothetical protein SESBI_04458 [Sesbania bispinosa]|nr:hypothetical protein SESBI_04458 [Sesbania bispinosa]
MSKTPPTTLPPLSISRTFQAFRSIVRLKKEIGLFKTDFSNRNVLVPFDYMVTPHLLGCSTHQMLTSVASLTSAAHIDLVVSIHQLPTSAASTSVAHRLPRSDIHRFGCLTSDASTLHRIPELDASTSDQLPHSYLLIRSIV